MIYKHIQFHIKIFINSNYVLFSLITFRNQGCLFREKYIRTMLIPLSTLMEPDDEYVEYRVRNVNSKRVQEFEQKLAVNDMELSSTLKVLVSP